MLFIALTHVSVYGQGEISFEKQAIDLGDVDPRNPIKVDIKFKNIGNEPITISRVVSSYNPFIISYPTKTIAPGE